MKRWLIVFAAMLFVLFLSACEHEGVVEVVRLKGTDVDEPRDQSTPEKVIENLALADRLRDVGLFRRQLDSSLVVRFPADPPEGHPGRGRDWNYEGKASVTGNLFADAAWIDFQMEHEKPVLSTIEGYPEEEGYRRVRVHGIDMMSVAVASADTFLVENDQIVYVLKDRSTTAEPEWRVVMEQLFWP